MGDMSSLVREEPMTTTYAAQGGETPAAGWVPPTWEEVVEQHSARVYRLAYRLTGNVHDAEDLTQDVFVRVFRSLHTYQPGTFEGWLHRITTNVFLDKMRRKQRIRFDALSDESAARLPSRGPGPWWAWWSRAAGHGARATRAAGHVRGGCASAPCRA